MRRLLLISAFMLLSVALSARGLDSLRREALGGKLSEYFGAIRLEPLPVQEAEADFMIEAATDLQVREFVAQWIYDFYLDSPVMGFESVAIHIFDKWFMPGTLKMASDMDFINARIFADFNRMSLLGSKAPLLRMEALDGSFVELFTDADEGDRFRVLYFYDTDCAKCRLETILLRNMISTESFPVDFYAIYAGDDREAWSGYVAERMDVSPGRITHLWDPRLESDFQRKYGVIQTPRLFLITPDGVVAGRGLDVASLSAMLHDMFDYKELTYGSDESSELFDNVFASAARPSMEDVAYLADYVQSNTLEKGDTVMFRQLSGDLMYYLSARTGEGIKEGLSYLLEDKILSRPDVWRSADDSLKVIGFARILDDMLSKARPGTEVVSLKVPGRLVTSAKTKDGSFRLDRLRGRRNVIIFYTEGCEVCDAEKLAARTLVKEEPKSKVLLVNVDGIVNSDPDLAGELFSSFDLSVLPFILETDRKGNILRRYITLQ